MSFTEGGKFQELAESPRGGYVGLGNVHTGALRTDKQVPEAVSRIEIGNQNTVNIYLFTS